MTEQEKFQAMIDELEAESMGFKNYDSAQQFDDDPSVLSMDGPSKADRAKSLGLSTYSFRMTYVAGATSLPVPVELFGTHVNTGTFVGDDLVFTNAGGDTVTISGITASFRFFMQKLIDGPKRIKFARIRPQDASMFSENIRFQEDTTLGSGSFNALLPDEFITPEQFQALRADVFMNYKIDSERRILFNVNPTEVAPGYVWTLWISGIVDETNKLDGKPSFIPMDRPGIQSGAPSRPLQAQIDKLGKIVIANAVSNMQKRPFMLKKGK